FLKTANLSRRVADRSGQLPGQLEGDFIPPCDGRGDARTPERGALRHLPASPVALRRDAACECRADLAVTGEWQLGIDRAVTRADCAEHRHGKTQMISK